MFYALSETVPYLGLASIGVVLLALVLHIHRLTGEIRALRAELAVEKREGVSRDGEIEELRANVEENRSEGNPVRSVPRWRRGR